MRTFNTSVLLSTGFLLAATACGPASPTVDVTLHTGLETAGRFKNLMNGFTLNALPFTPTGDCRQRNVLAALDSTPDDDGVNLETFRVDTTTSFDSGLSYVIDAAWASQYTSFKPITIPVPRGTRVGVGFIASFIASQHTDSDGACAEWLTGSEPYQTTSIFGHRELTATAPIDVPLKVWVMPAMSAATPVPTPVAGDPACSASVDPGQNCPGIEFFMFNCTVCSSYSRHVRIEYAIDRNRPEQRVVQWLRSSQVGGTVNIPNILPMRVTISSGPGADLWSTEIRSEHFTNGTNRQAVVSFPAGPIAPVAGSIVVTERSRRGPVTISPFTLQTPTGSSSLQTTFNWSTASNAEAYTLRYGTASGGPYSSIVVSNVLTHTYNLSGTVTPGTNYYFVVEASNNQGSPSVISNEQRVHPIAAWGSAPTASTGTSQIQVLWSTPPTGASESAAEFMIFARDISNNSVQSTFVAAGSTNGYLFGVPSGQYKVSVEAFNSYGGRSKSAESTATYTVP